MLAALLVLTPAVRDAEPVLLLAVLVAAVVAAAGTTRARSFLAVPLSVLAWPLSALRGLPLLGRTTSERVFVAGGHGMWGIALGPVTGMLVAETVLKGETPDVLRPFDPLR